MWLWALELKGMQGSRGTPVALVGTLFHSQDCAPASWLQSSHSIYYCLLLDFYKTDSAEHLHLHYLREWGMTVWLQSYMCA